MNMVCFIPKLTSSSRITKYAAHKSKLTLTLFYKYGSLRRRSIITQAYTTTRNNSQYFFQIKCTY
jgi:hypothetical protein